MSVEPNLSTKDLRAVIALSQTRSFGQAALQVHLSQSALSALIARVESQVGARLFERTTRAVELTDTGQIFITHAQELLRNTQRALRAVSDSVLLKTGSVTVAALPSLAASLVPKVFANFLRLHPAVRLSLIDTLSGPAFDLVRDGKVDFALTAADPKQEDLAYEQLTTDEFLLICPEGHSLCSRPSPIALEDTLDYPHVSMSGSASVRQYIDADVLSKGLRFTPVFEVDHIATIGALVSEGLGISALPETAISLLKAERLAYIPLSAPGIQRPLGIVTRRHVSPSLAAQELSQMLKTSLSMLLKR
ncbi:MAG: LysR family transcriptional regulator [Comamonas sp.]|jgi:LysR family carnitine catabolism transcriptional activator|uniref:LysR family transcriptional regulator n=1 Tax=Comamonas sp. TaxID=34028 RepID=UPI002FCC5BD2